MWILKTEEGADPALTFRILPGNIRTIGRATGANFIVDAHLVSRVHCQLTAGAADLEVKDLDSTNGTFVNGERIQGTARLTPGDRLGVGQVQLAVERN